MRSINLDNNHNLEGGYSIAERLPTRGLAPPIADLIEAEREIPVVVDIDRSLRPKILDNCGMTCTFCHKEGTPVSAAYSGSLSLPNPKYRGGRVSVFQENNSVDFLPDIMHPDAEYLGAITTLARLIGANELHLTGGEPTLHPELPTLIKISQAAGYRVKMTSNGENGENVLADCAAAGLEKVNFSIFGTTPEELAAVQHEKFRNPKRAEAKLRMLRASIDTALASNIKADANIVMSSPEHSDRVRRVIGEYDERLSVRILNDLGVGDDSYLAIYGLLASMGAEPVELHVGAGSSNSRVKYTLPNGRSIFFKQIRRITLPAACGDCSLNNDTDCSEGYYGVRLMK